MEVPLDVAAARMVKAIERRRKSYSFPKWLAFSLAVLRCLPPTVADAIVQQRPASAKFARLRRNTARLTRRQPRPPRDRLT